MRLATSSSRLRFLTGFASLVLAASACAETSSLLEEINREVASLYENSKDAVVRVYAECDSPTNPILLPPRRCGTGFFIDRDGRLLTAASVVGGADRCWIEWRGRRVPVKLLGTDATTHLGVLQADMTICGTETPALPVGDPGSLRIGSMLITIGYPYDRPSAPVIGFISGFDIRCGALVLPTTHIRASCRLSPGQAGGPLLDIHGSVVGVAMAAHFDDHCLVLPINAARKVFDDILKLGESRHAHVGLAVEERQTTDPTNQWQVLVRQVSPNSPAAVAGFLPGDVLLKIDTNRIQRSGDVLDVLFYHSPGDRLSFTVLRDGSEREIPVVVDSRSAESPQATRPLSPRRMPPLIPASSSK